MWDLQHLLGPLRVPPAHGNKQRLSWSRDQSIPCEAASERADNAATSPAALDQDTGAAASHNFPPASRDNSALVKKISYLLCAACVQQRRAPERRALSLLDSHRGQHKALLQPALPLRASCAPACLWEISSFTVPSALSYFSAD